MSQVTFPSPGKKLHFVAGACLFSNDNPIFQAYPSRAAPETPFPKNDNLF